MAWLHHKNPDNNPWLGRCGTPYGATPPMSTSIKVTNTANFKITIKEAVPCVKGAGTTLAVLQPGDTYVVTTVCVTAAGASSQVQFGEKSHFEEYGQW